jgi:hypothetical protein
MSASPNVLTVIAKDRLADIAVLDGGLNPVARGIGHLQAGLPSGIYKVEARSGPTVTRQLVALDRDRDVALGLAPFPSPIPLAGTSRTHEEHQALVSDVSSTASVKFGNGASILVVARDWSPEDKPDARKADDPAAGLVLCRADGTRLAAVKEGAQQARSGNGDPASAWRAELDPGPYRLRLELPDGTGLERSLYVAPDLQTQIFLLQRDYRLDNGTTVRRADFDGAGMSTPFYGAFHPASDRVRMAELARYALTQSRPVLSDDLLKQLLDEKFDDPILGLLGAHVLLRDKPLETSLFRIVTGNLRNLVGEQHPDLCALWLRRTDGHHGSDRALPSPPMLRASWDIAVEESVSTPSLIPPDSTCGQIAGRVAPSATWLLWRREAQGADAGSQAIQQALRMYLEARDRLDKAALPRPKRIAQLINRPIRKLTQAAPSWVTQAFSSMAPSLPLIAGVSSFGGASGFGMKASPPPAVPELDVAEKMELARSLGVSGHLLDVALQTLSRGGT